MYCPKCGAENPDANKYCRTCREGLLVVAQAMKKRLPVAIASKIDAALGRLSERFRRDSILWLFCGSGMLISTVIHFNRSVSDGFDLFIGVSFSMIGLLAGTWSYLAYKRSLTLGDRLESGQFSSESPVRSTVRSLGIVTLDLSGAEKPAAQAPGLQILFCPACGAKAVEALKHCRSCGANLRAVRAAVEPSRWRVWLNYYLDSHIEAVSDKSRIRENVRHARWAIWVWVGWIFLGAIDVYKKGDPTFLLFGCMFLVTTLWDRAASRRWFPEEETASDTKTCSDGEPTAAANAKTTNELSLPAAQLPLSVTEASTRKLEPVVQEDAINTRQL